MKSILLSLSFLFPFFMFSQVNLDSGLVAYYPFDGDANDYSVNAINGIPSNVGYSTGVYGGSNTSILFNGSDSSFVDCGTDNRGITDSITISVFVRTTFDGIGDIVSKYDPGNDHGYHFQMSLGKIRFAGRDGSGNYRSTGYSLTSINDSSWHHIIGVVRANTWLIYIDCTLEGAQSNSTVNPDISSAANLGIGKDVFSNQKFLDCEVDEVRIYNRELTADEMDSLCYTAASASTEEFVEKDENFIIYPNPAKNFLTISGIDFTEKQQLIITDMSGRIVLEKLLDVESTKIDISNLSSGNYLAIVSDGQKLLKQKLIIF
ncbi:T9SS type A sorting domain-containing protein [Paracrocinitomix mangrovi]|uniref:LamG domain-containing protein n=1 Tax=Paracrocinitomix mangrovi TaxID=2862509 RepID=UPI001C8D7DD1|nr:LamG domain-containing protein [Paracrocinitomix mangrovi]UKN02905.1 T9SS type A sorting domain-containing protein [Paracrocinitomix mangrovi]